METVTFICIIAFPFVFLACAMTVLKIVLAKTATQYKIIPENDEKVDVKSLKFLQYNVFWRPTLLHMGRAEYMRERSKLLLDKIEKYDVVCLDEAFQFGSTIVSEFVEAVQQRGFKYIVSSKNPPLTTRQVIDSGLLLLSKYPILETDTIRYTDGCGFDSFSAKGSVYAKIKISAKEHIHVFATHLQASYEAGPTSEDVGIRCRQFDQLSEFMDAKVTDAAPTFVLGDLNVNSRKGTEYELLLKHLHINKYTGIDTIYAKHNEHLITLGDSTGGVIHDDVLTVKDDRGTNQCLDYIFLFTNQESSMKIGYEPNVQKMLIDGHKYPQLSDHYAVECTFTFN